MALPRCYLIPGFAGSELRAIRVGVNQPFWVDKNQLVNGNFKWLKLASDGITPDKSDGVLMTATVPLEEYYGLTRDSLKPQLLNNGIELAMIGYDWRLGAQSLGNLIADVIRGDGISGTKPCSLVAHSYGGQVARFAYESLRLTGQQNMVRRLITLGTPHQGTYSALETGSGGGGILEQIAWAQNLAAEVGPVPGAGAGKRLGRLIKHTSPRELGNICLTWPALYDLMPIPGGDDSVGDPHRADIYDFDKWDKEANVSKFLLRFTDQITNPFLMDESKLPPLNVLTTVAGVGFQTLWGLKHPERLGNPDAIEGTRDGDGTATYKSALIFRSRKYSIVAAHLDLPLILARNGRLLTMILDNSPIFLPPAEVPLLQGGGVQVLYGPPFPFPVPNQYVTTNCIGKGCSC